jgi:L-lactate dehydrogenase complex protein LldG
MTTASIASENSFQSQDYLSEFISRFERLSGKAYRCSSEQESINLMEKLISERGQGKCYVAKEVLDFFPSRNLLQFAGTIKGANLYDPPDSSDGLDVLKDADIGITTASFAIAETGCLVEVAFNDSSKLLSSLSRVNIVLVKATNLLQKLQDLAPILQDLLSKKEKPTITLISGPSRTSDIEMKFVLGVHGPHEVYAIIVE